jgi:opacity protein-like surface antigen
LTAEKGNIRFKSAVSAPDFLGTVRGRAGYVVDSFMLYGTGGAAIGDIKASAPGFRGMSETRTGWTVGGGVEWNVFNNWTAKAEYLHVDLGKMNCGFNCGMIANNTVSLTEDLVRGGIITIWATATDRRKRSQLLYSAQVREPAMPHGQSHAALICFAG